MHLARAYRERESALTLSVYIPFVRAYILELKAFLCRRCHHGKCARRRWPVWKGYTWCCIGLRQARETRERERMSYGRRMGATARGATIRFRSCFFGWLRDSGENDDTTTTSTRTTGQGSFSLSRLRARLTLLSDDDEASGKGSPVLFIVLAAGLMCQSRGKVYHTPWGLLKHLIPPLVCWFCRCIFCKAKISEKPIIFVYYSFALWF